MKGIFSYLDYRDLLRDRFIQFKKERRGVSHRSLSRKAGFASPNFLKLVMDGDRNLTFSSVPKVCEAFEFFGREGEFFSRLVLFNQAKKIEEKDQAYEALKRLRHDLPLRRVEHSQFEYLDHWYGVAIRELVGLKDFKEDPRWIRSRLKGKATLPQIRNALRLLERLGFVRRDAKGKLVVSDAVLTTGDEVAHLGIYRYHDAMLKKAQESLRETKAEERDISSVTLSVSKEMFHLLKERIQAFRKEILGMAEQSENDEAVYQMNIQFFPLSETLWNS